MVGEPEVAETRKVCYSRMTWGLVLTGIVLRLAYLLHNRCFWNDELAVALAFREPTIDGVLSALSMRAQIAPLGFLLLVKGAVTTFGQSEWCFRLVPFVASVVGLFLMRALVTRWLHPVAAVISLALVSLNVNLVYYANELKPYAVDQMVAIALIILALHGQRRRWTGRWLWLLALGGLAAPWFSFPSTLILAVIGLITFAGMLRVGEYSRALIAAAIGIAWLLGFGLEYAIVRSVAESDYMHTFWHRAFLPFPPQSLRDILWIPQSLAMVFRNPFLTAIKELSLVLCIFGWYRCWRTHRTLASVLCGPLLLGLIASAAHVYPFGDRLAQYLIPSLAIGIGLGLQPFFESSRRWQLSGVCLVAVTMGEPGLRACKYALRGPVHEESKPVLQHVAAHWQNGDVLYVHPHSLLSLQYYGSFVGLTAEQSIRGESVEFNADPVVRSTLGQPRVWFYFAHALPEQVAGFTQRLDQSGRRLDTIELRGCSAYLYDLTLRISESDELSEGI